MKRLLILNLTCVSLLLACLAWPAIAETTDVIRSVRSGPWSESGTWENGAVPGSGARVLVRTGHHVIYDVSSDVSLRAVHVSGTLSFATDRDTRMDVSLLKIQAGDSVEEEGFDCEAHLVPSDDKMPRATLFVGSAKTPVPAEHTALIRLLPFAGMKEDSLPAIVCCGGRMEFHGAEMPRTWLKLEASAKTGTRDLTLAEPPTGWHTGDRVILVATTRQNKIKKTFLPTIRGAGQTEERRIVSIEGTRLTLDAPLDFDHFAEGGYAGEVANLSRNVIVESADPERSRGHTMYHRGSVGAISYAEFRHLGKPGVLGRYSLHFHLVGDTMRGASVIGASIWDSGNRWLTIHGTNGLVVQDCVGYQSLGHGFFLEDGTEINNMLDRNLAVQAFTTDPLPKQVLPFDKNDGSGFWWANSRNSFTRNVAAECDEYGYFFQATKNDAFDPVLPVVQPDGTRAPTDIRTLPFIRFDDNEAHTMRRHALNLGGGAPFGGDTVYGVGPDAEHPFVIRNLKCWDVHWAVHPVSPSLWIDGADFFQGEYGVWRPEYKGHYYRDIRFSEIPEGTRYAFTKGKPNEDSDFPIPAERKHDQPPYTVITHAMESATGNLQVRGVTASDNEVTRVVVNGQKARVAEGALAAWSIDLSANSIGSSIEAYAEDAHGNQETRPHRIPVPTD